MLTADDLPAVREHLNELLSGMGFRPKPAGDGDIQLHVEGWNHVLCFHEKDPAFVMWLVPGFYDIESDLERDQVYVAANDTNKRIKGPTVFLYDHEKVSLSIEFLVTGIEALTEDLLARQLKMSITGIGHFNRKMDELRSAADEALGKWAAGPH